MIGTRWSSSVPRSWLRSGALHSLAAVSRRPRRGTRHLFFHGIESADASAFADFLDYLLSIGSVVPLGEAVDAEQISHLPTFTISFDDGFADNLTVAGPILAARHIRATIFVATAFVGLHGGALRRFTIDRLRWHIVRRSLTVEELREAAGTFDIQSHGVSHADFAMLEEASARAELTDSKKRLEDWTGQPVSYFAWPFGQPENFPVSFIRVAREVGYSHVFAGVSASRLPRSYIPVVPRRQISLEWGPRICRYLARSGS